jgi:hypothetical protein
MEKLASNTLYTSGEWHHALEWQEESSRIIQGTEGSKYYGGNNNTQLVLHNTSEPTTLADKGADWYVGMLDVISGFGLPSLEHWNRFNCLSRYANAYSCKGNSSPQDWKKTLDQITDKYVNDNSNSEKTLGNLMGKHMNEITRGMYISKDQALYCNSNGVMERSSAPNIKSCSVNSILVELLGKSETSKQADEDPDSNKQKPSNSFTWLKVLDRYSECSPDTHQLNLYKFIIFNWIKDKLCVPNIFGYKRKITKLVLPKDFHMCTLALYKHFIKSHKWTLSSIIVELPVGRKHAWGYQGNHFESKEARTVTGQW